MLIDDSNESFDTARSNQRGSGGMPESPDTPSWGPPSGDLPESPITPPWGAPGGDILPESPDTPSWGPPSGDLPESPDTPSWGPPSGDLPESPITPPWRPPVIVIPSRPNNPGSSNVRFLYAAVNQPAVNIQLGKRMVIKNFSYSNVTPYYLESASNNKSIVITSAYSGAVIYSGQFTFLDGYAYTVAIVNDGDSISLFTIIDTPCKNAGNMSCIRTVNLSPNSGPVDIFMSGVGRVYRNIDTFDISAYRKVYGKTYRAFVSEALPCANNSAIIMSNNYVACNNTRNAILDSDMINLKKGVLYTLFIIGLAYDYPALQILTAESDLVY